MINDDEVNLGIFSSDAGLPSSNSSLESSDGKSLSSSSHDQGREALASPTKSERDKEESKVESGPEPEKPKHGNGAIMISNDYEAAKGDNNNYKKGSGPVQCPLGDSQEPNKSKSVTTRDETTATAKAREDDNNSDKEN